MKNLIITVTTVSALLFSSCYHLKKEKNMDQSKNQNENAIFPEGEKITNNYFTGTAWLKMLVSEDSVFNCPVGNVTFEPGCRNNWHYHPGGQILLCTSGKGYYQEKGQPVRLLQKGDVVMIHPDIVHWHGATPDNEFSHLAISTNPEKGLVVWMGAVNDKEYNNYKTEEQK